MAELEGYIFYTKYRDETIDLINKDFPESLKKLFIIKKIPINYIESMYKAELLTFKLRYGKDSHYYKDKLNQIKNNQSKDRLRVLIHPQGLLNYMINDSILFYISDVGYKHENRIYPNHEDTRPFIKEFLNNPDNYEDIFNRKNKINLL